MEFDRKCLMILKCFSKPHEILELDHLQLLTKYAQPDILERLDYMWRNEYIRIVAREQPKHLYMDARFQVTTKAKIFLKNRKKNVFYKWQPIVVSTIAIILSIIALVVSLKSN